MNGRNEKGSHVKPDFQLTRNKLLDNEESLGLEMGARWEMPCRWSGHVLAVCWWQPSGHTGGSGACFLPTPPAPELWLQFCPDTFAPSGVPFLHHWRELLNQGLKNGKKTSERQARHTAVQQEAHSRKPFFVPRKILPLIAELCWGDFLDHSKILTSISASFALCVKYLSFLNVYCINK